MDADEPVRAIRRLIAAGEYLHAYDRAMSAIEEGSGEKEMKFLAVLSLARSGATYQAARRYDSLGLASIDPESIPVRLAQDIAGLAARLDKDTALRRTDQERIRWARRSAERYQHAFERWGSAFLGVNAASMWLVAGERNRAEAMGRAALEALEGSGAAAEGDRYWDAVSEAEAALILGEINRAREALEHAGAIGPENHAARATTLRQLRLVCDLVDVDPGILAAIANPTVVHFCGHRTLSGGHSGRFPAAEELRVAGELRRVFADLSVGFGFGSLAAGADILAAEALLECGAHLHVVLPFDQGEFLSASVAPAGADWVRRFERCLGEADRVDVATRGEYLNDPTLFDFCARIAMGDALMRAAFLEAEAHQVAVWDGTKTEEVAGTAVDVANWGATGRPATIIPVEPADRVNTDATTPAVRRIRGILFADFAGFSTLTDAQVLVFQEHVMGGLARAIEPFQAELLSGRTWGDGLNLVFSDVASAADASLALQAAAARFDFAALGLPSVRGLRVAAHATPVFEGRDPITGSRVFFGAGVTQAARIEPRTPEGEIYTTHSFAALATLAGDRSYETQYIGMVPTAKGYGSIPLFALRRRV